MSLPSRNVREPGKPVAASADRAKRILFLNWRDPKHPEAGGAERYVLEVALAMQRRGYAVRWLTAGFPGARRHERVDGIDITRIGDRLTVYFALPAYVLIRLRHRFDYVVDAENGIPFFSPLFTRATKICLIFHVHQRVFEAHLPFPVSVVMKWIEARLMPALYRRSRFVAISDDTRRDLIALGVPAADIDIAYSGYDSKLAPKAKTEHPSIVYVGRLKKYKRVDAVIAAFATVLASIPTATLVIAGTGDQAAALQDLALRLGIARAVRFEGYVDEPRKRELYGSAWLFAMASEMEGWGLTIVEAAACATPTVAVGVPGVREAIVDGQSGLLVDGTADLAAAIQRVVVDASLRQRLSSGALARAATFSWERTADVILDALTAGASAQTTSCHPERVG